MSTREVVLSRDELVEYLAERLPDKTDIGRMTTHIEKAFVFQNDVGRPAYMLEVDPGAITPEAIAYISDCLEQMTVCACLVPKGMVSYGATVTPESMGVENIKTIMFDRQPVDWQDFPTADESE